jgi:hypothetical protein
MCIVIIIGGVSIISYVWLSLDISWGDGRIIRKIQFADILNVNFDYYGIEKKRIGFGGNVSVT